MSEPRFIQRCRASGDQCRLPDGSPAKAECSKVEGRAAWICPNCGRQYADALAFQFREEAQP